jgi:hypothetical protein
VTAETIAVFVFGIANKAALNDKRLPYGPAILADYTILDNLRLRWGFYVALISIIVCLILRLAAEGKIKISGKGN